MNELIVTLAQGGKPAPARKRGKRTAKKKTARKAEKNAAESESGESAAETGEN